MKIYRLKKQAGIACAVAAVSMLLSLSMSAVGKEGDNPSPGKYRASEWGTFTTLHHANGTPIKWYQSPIGRSSELPSFIYGSRARKVNPYFFARMETPVIYFYPESAQVIDVKATYPEGEITEVYPGASWVYGNWQKLEIIPAAEAKAKGLEKRFPQDPKQPGNHYFEARSVPDAAVVRLSRDGKPEVQQKTDQYERFLFYRGAGNFRSPLRYHISRDRGLTLYNSESELKVDHAWVLQSTPDTIRWQKMGPLVSGGDIHDIDFSKLDSGLSREESISKLTQSMVVALVNSGLSQQEADAMVATWDAHWYEEPGHRVLSIVPRKHIDQILPLEFTPKPESVARVFVHRAEILSPDLMDQLRLAMAADTKPEKAAEILAAAHLGRFRYGAIEATAVDVGRTAESEHKHRGMIALRTLQAEEAKAKRD